MKDTAGRGFDVGCRFGSGPVDRAVQAAGVRGGYFFLEGFELVEGAGPVGAEEAGEAAVGEDFAAGLAGGAVVGFVVGVADALDGCGAAGAGEIEAAVHGHVGAEGGDFFGEGLLSASALKRSIQVWRVVRVAV